MKDIMGNAVEKVFGLEALCYTPSEFNRKKKEPGIVRVAVEEGIDLLGGAA